MAPAQFDRTWSTPSAKNRPLKPVSNAGVAEECRRLRVQSKADAKAQLNVFREMDMPAGAEVLLALRRRFAGGHDAKVFGMNIQAVAQRHVEHRGRRPLIEIVALVIGR